MIPLGLFETGTQQDLGDIIGITQPRVSQLMTEGVIPKGTLLEQVQAYTSWLREQAAGRASADGGLDLVQERAALAREQRVGQAIKNLTAQREYAPVSLLSTVLAAAGQAVVDRLDALPSQLRKVCPDLPDGARRQIDATVASARNEMRRATERLVLEQLAVDDEDLDDVEHEDGAPVTGEPA